MSIEDRTSLRTWERASVVDPITNYEGIVIGRCENFDGLVQYLVQTPLPDAAPRWFNASRLTSLTKKFTPGNEIDDQEIEALRETLSLLVECHDPVTRYVGAAVTFWLVLDEMDAQIGVQAVTEDGVLPEPQYFSEMRLRVSAFHDSEDAGIRSTALRAQFGNEPATFEAVSYWVAEGGLDAKVEEIQQMREDYDAGALQLDTDTIERVVSETEPGAEPDDHRDQDGQLQEVKTDDESERCNRAAEESLKDFHRAKDAEANKPADKTPAEDDEL